MRLPLALVLSLLVLAPIAAAQVDVPPIVSVDYDHDTGWVSNDTDREQIIIGFPVTWDTGRSLRLYFDEVTLSGNPWDGSGSILRITSLKDGGQQTLNAEHVRQWQKSTAYFNGDIVVVEVIAQPGTGPNRLVMKSLEVGITMGQEESQCGPTDDRVPSNDPRVGRLMPVVCTAWMIDDCNHCFLSAGHCVGSIDTVQFNVPLSSPGGSLNHPPPEHQYAVDSSSIQSNGGQGTGNDWAYFGCFPNSITGLPPSVAQGAFFILAAPPPVSGNTIRITGYGADSGSADNTQQTHAGPFVSDSGTTLGYQADTQGGNSGSPVIWDEQDVAIGIHTHGGCSSGSNKGTDLANHAAFQAALNNPQGLCGSCGPPVITSLSPDTLPSFPSSTLTILGNNLAGTLNVTVGSTVYGPGEIFIQNPSRVDVILGLPATLGVEQVTITTSQGTSNPSPLTWVAPDPPVLDVPVAVNGGESLTWQYAGTPGDTAYLIVSLTSGTFPFGGFSILSNPIILKVAPLGPTSFDSLTVTAPSGSVLFIYSQVVTLNGGVTGASTIISSVIFP